MRLDKIFTLGYVQFHISEILLLVTPIRNKER